MNRFLVLNGPNLDWLGTREPEVYGTETLAGLTALLDEVAGELGVELDHFQSNHEGELVERIHAAARSGCRGALVNAGGYTHTSVWIIVEMPRNRRGTSDELITWCAWSGPGGNAT